MNTDTRAPGVVLELEEQQTHPAPAVRSEQSLQSAPAAAGRQSPSISELLASAYERGADPQVLAQLLQLKAEFERQEARKAFVRAMAEFKKNPPEIIKDKLVEFQGRNADDKTSYRHATLAAVCKAAIEGLAAVGISHSWSAEQEPGLVRVFCTLTHDQGHSERVQLQAPADTSGKKNAIQSVGSSVTYLERYTLLMITGLATADQDDDGMQHKDPVDAWIVEYREAIASARDLSALIAAWKTAAGACRRKKNEQAYEELQHEVVSRRNELGVTPEQWAAVVGK